VFHQRPFSYQKEVEFEGEPHNLVVVVENFLTTTG